MVLLIDNYDSFTYNLYQYLGELGEEVAVFRNDKIDEVQIKDIDPDKIVISPGPKTPDEAGNCLKIIEKFYRKIPILGVCLGHQCIGQYFGGKVIHAPKPFHGKTSLITHQGKGIFEGLENPLKVARYHSLIIEKSSLPENLEITAETDDGIIMALKHREFPVYGIQFHPESINTDHGKKIIENFLKAGV